MSEWWNSLDTLMKTLYCIAVPASLLLLIQTVLSFVGFADGGGGMEFSDTSGLDLDMGDGSLDIPDADIPTQHEFAGDGGNPADFTALRLFTLQGVVAFLTVFSWTSIVSIGAGTLPLIGILAGLIFGLVAMFTVAKLIQLSAKLTENGTLNMKNAIGQSGTVYLTIPPDANGVGKVTLEVQGRFVEQNAMTYGEKILSTGTAIRVIDLRGDTLVVEEDR